MFLELRKKDIVAFASKVIEHSGNSDPTWNSTYLYDQFKFVETFHAYDTEIFLDTVFDRMLSEDITESSMFKLAQFLNLMKNEDYIWKTNRVDFTGIINSKFEQKLQKLIGLSDKGQLSPATKRLIYNLRGKFISHFYHDQIYSPISSSTSLFIPKVMQHPKSKPRNLHPKSHSPPHEFQTSVYGFSNH